MSRKGTKIKRYGSIYGRNSGSMMIVLAMIAGLVIFGVAGWFLYTPVHNFIMSLGDKEPQAESSQPSAVQPGEAESDVPSVPAAPSAVETINGIYLPADILLDAEAFASALDKAAADGFNTVAVDAKAASGRVLYRSDNEIAKSSGVAADSLYDAKEVAAQIKRYGLSPAVRLHAFEDSLAPIARRDIAVHYEDTNIYWFDDSPELGGKPWLNPYSEGAREYIISLIEELCAAGFETILLESVQFPDGVALDKAGFGESAAGTSKLQMLSQFAAGVEETAERGGAQLILCFDSDWLAPGAHPDNEWRYGSEPSAFFSDRVFITLDTDSSVWNSRLSMIGDVTDSELLAIVPAYASDGTLTENSNLAAAVTDAGAKGYILFNPQGNYKSD